MINEQNENISRNIEIIRRNQTEILKLKIITELKILLDEFKSRFEQIEDKIIPCESDVRGMVA